MSAIAFTPRDAEAKNAPTSGRLVFLNLGAGGILPANPDGSDLKTIINEGRRLPDGLVLDVAAVIRRPFLTSSTSQVQAHEAGLQQRTVVVEFDSYEIALKAHESEAYQKALQALGSGAERDYGIVEGA